MTRKTDYKNFQAMLNAHCPDKAVTAPEAAAAFLNLGEFVSLLVQINDEVKLVPLESEPPVLSESCQS